MIQIKNQIEMNKLVLCVGEIDAQTEDLPKTRQPKERRIDKIKHLFNICAASV